MFHNKFSIFVFIFFLMNLSDLCASQDHLFNHSYDNISFNKKIVTNKNNINKIRYLYYGNKEIDTQNHFSVREFVLDYLYQKIQLKLRVEPEIIESIKGLDVADFWFESAFFVTTSCSFLKVQGKKDLSTINNNFLKKDVTKKAYQFSKYINFETLKLIYALNDAVDNKINRLELFEI